MDRIAVISDIHGNMPALDAVLADIDARAITRIYCLGDLVGKGPHSDRAVDLCRERCDGVIRGNWDDGMANAPDDNPMLIWHRERLGVERLDFLRNLPNTIEFVMSGRSVRLLHASPQGVYHRIYQSDTYEVLNTMFANTDFTGDQSTPDVVGYGDIHSAYLRTFHHKMLFNVGSVGNPLDLTLACYAILEGSFDQSASTPFSITMIRVPYDIERAIQQAADEGMPEIEPYANELRTARYRGIPD